MKKIVLLLTALLSLFTLGITVLIISVGISAFTKSSAESKESQVNPDAFVYIHSMGIDAQEGVITFQGLRNGFAIGNGPYILTAAHCLEAFVNTNQTLIQPMVISPYYDDIFEAEIVAMDRTNDIGILKASWDTHPSLELETSEDWRKSKTIEIIGYPPPAPSRGGNGSQSRHIMSEEVVLRTSSGKGSAEVQLGPVHYPGKGWSGSPLINPQTGKVVGILAREHFLKKFFFFKQHLILGGSVDSIQRVLTDNSLSHEVWQVANQEPRGRHQFERILGYLDAMKPDNQEQTRKAIKECCVAAPDSYLTHIIAGWTLDHPEDEPYFHKAVEIAPDSILVRAAYGHHLFAYGAFEEAVEQFEFVVKQDADHLFAHHGLLASLVHIDPEKAETLGKELTDHWPLNAEFWFEYSKALRAQNKFAEQLSAIQETIALCAEVPHLYQRHLADSLMANGQYETSEQAYKTLLEVHECTRCWSAYASLLEKMGPDKADAAKEVSAKAKSLSSKQKNTGGVTEETSKQKLSPAPLNADDEVKSPGGGAEL